MRREHTQQQRDFKSDAPRSDIPREGYYRRRLVKNGPWSPISISYAASQEDRSPMWVATLNGEYVSVFDVWPDCSGEPITEDEFKYLESVRSWAVTHAPTAPEANPKQSIDVNKIAPIKW